MKTNFGFNNAVFLTETEWSTYLKRKPVRYIKKKKDSVCAICGEKELPNFPLQNAHIIGFDIGITHLALTPDFLDGEHNIVTAHRGKCNKLCELSLLQSIEKIKDLGYILPNFLSSDVLNMI